MVEHWIVAPAVTGSNPVGHPNFPGRDRPHRAIALGANPASGLWTNSGLDWRPLSQFSVTPATLRLEAAWLDPPARSDPSPPGRSTVACRARARPDGVRTGSRRSMPFVGGIAAVHRDRRLRAPEPARAPLTTRDVNQAIASALASQTPAAAPLGARLRAIQPSIVLIETDDATDANGTAARAASAPVSSSTTPAPSSPPSTSSPTRPSIKLTFADGSQVRRRRSPAASRRPTSPFCSPDTPPANIVPATLGNPAAMRIGSEAYIVGNPFGLYGSLSSGRRVRPRPLVPGCPTATASSTA